MSILRTTSGNPVATIVVLLLFVIPGSALVLVGDFFLLRAGFQQILALGYPTAAGTIIASEVKSDDDGEDTTYLPVIKYAYSVGGKQYEGDRYRYGKIATGDRRAQRIVAMYPVGQQVEVRYAPNDPAEAVLLAGLEAIDFSATMFLWPFNVVMLGMWAAIFDGLRHRFFPPPAGRARVYDEGGLLRVRLAIVRPLYVAVAVSGGVAFALTFIVGFSVGADAPAGALIAAWTLILIGGVIAYFRVQQRLAQGDWDLVIDHFHSTVTLPRTFGRVEETVIPAQQIVGVEVERLGGLDSQGNQQRSYIPTVILADGDTPPRREKLIEWNDESAAERFAAWLGAQLHIASIAESPDGRGNLPSFDTEGTFAPPRES